MSPDEANDTRVMRRHLALGWSMLALFMVLGMGLEALHAFKLGWYLDLSNETRRLMLRLAHAHGALLGVLNIAFALSWRHRVPAGAGLERAVSVGLGVGALLLPLGFLLGGLVVDGGDPNPAVALSPVGALCVAAVAVFMAWRLVLRPPTGADVTASTPRDERTG